MIEQVMVGLLTGAAYALAGWRKNLAKDVYDDELDWFKLGKTVVVCGVVGAVAGYTGNDFNLLIVSGLGVDVTKVVDLVVGYVKAKFFND